MRRAFASALVEIAEHNPDVWLLYGDLGYGLVDEFARRFPERCLNCGIAEQNMMGTAAGLALCGKVVFVYSITNFVTLRCLEQVRNDVCLHRANVKIVASGVGEDYAGAGPSHYGTEDADVMVLMPGMRVVTPHDGDECAMLTRLAAHGEGPWYLRLRRT